MKVKLKLTNVPPSLNNLKTKVDDLNVGKLKTVPLDLKILSHVVDNEAVKNTKFNTVKTKVNNLDKKIPDWTTLICINQCNTDKPNFENKIGYFDKKIQDSRGLVLQLFWIQKLVKLRTKYQILLV